MVIILMRGKRNVGLFVARKVTFKGEGEDFVTERGTVFLNINPPQAYIPTQNFEDRLTGETQIEGMNLIEGNNPKIQTETLAFTPYETTFTTDVLASEIAQQYTLVKSDFHY